MEKQELLGPNWLIAYINQGHDFIAATYVSSMAQILKEFGNQMGYSATDQFYTDLAWGGLQGTDAFNNLTETTRNRILDVIAVELTGKDQNGNIKIQKGTDAGC